MESHFSVGKYAEYDSLAVFVEGGGLGNHLTFVLGLTRFDGCLWEFLAFEGRLCCGFVEVHQS